MKKYVLSYRFKNSSLKDSYFIDTVFLCISVKLKNSIDVFMKNRVLDDAVKQPIIDGRKLYLSSFLACKDTAKFEFDGSDWVFSVVFNENNPAWSLISQMPKKVFISEFVNEFVLNWRLGMNLLLYGNEASDEQKEQLKLMDDELSSLLENQYNPGSELFSVTTK